MKKLIYIALIFYAQSTFTADNQGGQTTDARAKMVAIMRTLKKRLDDCYKADASGVSCQQLQELYNRYTSSPS